MGSGSFEAIACRNVTKEFKKRKVLDDVGFTLSGGVNLLVGENGAGKSTLFYLISGIIKPDRGIATLNGIDSWKRHRQAMNEVSFMTEKPSVLGGSLVREHIYWFASLKGTGTERIVDYLHLFRVDYVLPATFQSLSQGEMQLVMIACYLSTDSSIFILDEPNSNLDVNKRSLVSTAIRQKADRSGSTFLISTHVLDEMMTIYDKILVLDKGSARFSAETGKPSYMSVLRTSNNDLVIVAIKEEDKGATLMNDAIFTSLNIKRCAEIASEKGIVIVSYFLIPEEMVKIYE